MRPFWEWLVHGPKVPRDHNMLSALRLGQEMSRGELIFHPWLKPCLRRAHLVHRIDQFLVRGATLRELRVVELLERARDVAGLVYDYGYRFHPISAEDAGNRRVSGSSVLAGIGLRLWAGCLMGAKVIALETRSGPNTARGRAERCARIGELAADDLVFRAGAEAARAFKLLRGEPFSLDGVPEGSILWPHQGR